MPPLPRRPEIGLPLLGVALAALWPLTAWAIAPVFLPAILALAGATALVLRRPEYGIALALALAPFIQLSLSLPSGPLAGMVPASPLTLAIPAIAGLVLGYAVLVSSGRRLAPEARWLLIAVSMFVASLLLSSAYALDSARSLSKVFLLLTAVILFLAVLQVCDDRRKLLVVVGGAVVGLLAASVQGVVQHQAGMFAETFDVGGSLVGRVKGSFEHPNQFAGYLAALLPLAAVIVLKREFPGALRWLAAAAAILTVPAIAYSFARGSIIALILGAIVWAALLRPRLAVKIGVVIALGALLFTPGTLKERFSPAQGAESDVTQRLGLWRAAGEMYSQEPVLGVGVNNYRVAYVELPPSPGVDPLDRLYSGDEDENVVPPHAHNMYLNVLAEQGIVGALAFGFLLLVSVGVVYRGCKVRDRIGRTVCFGIGMGLMTLLASGFFQISLYTEAALPAFALLAVAASFVGLDRDARRAPPRAARTAPG